MSKKEINPQEEWQQEEPLQDESLQEEPQPEEQAEEQVEEQAEDQNEETIVSRLEATIAEQAARIEALEDIKLRQMAEFDNFRRRTNKEKADLLARAGERILTDMLPLIDDLERAIDNVQRDQAPSTKEDERYQAMEEGVKLIYQKFLAFLDKNDVHVIETEDADFNTDEHEAVTTFAAGDEKKGKVVDCTQKGYKLGDKVIRYAKVVVGE